MIKSRKYRSSGQNELHENEPEVDKRSLSIAGYARSGTDPVQLICSADAKEIVTIYIESR
jgi:hypothetical protein